MAQIKLTSASDASRRRLNPRYLLLAAVGLLVAICSIVVLSQPEPLDHTIEASSEAVHEWWSYVANATSTLFQQTPVTESKVAFATFLSAYHDKLLGQNDDYYQAVRQLNYQLQHDPLTRSDPRVPLIALVSTKVEESKREVLRSEGAVVIEGKDLTPGWMKKELKGGRWGDVMVKMNLASMTGYDKICFIDADTMIYDRMDGIFSDPATDVRWTGNNTKETAKNEAPLPAQYMFAAMLERGSQKHAIPPKPEAWDKKGINAGFFCLHPSQTIFEYYLSVLAAKGKFYSFFPEQNMLNLVHRPKGNMPWAHLKWDWNTKDAGPRDMDAGVKSFHGKWWMKEKAVLFEKVWPEFNRIWVHQQRQMEAYYNSSEWQTKKEKLASG